MTFEEFFTKKKIDLAQLEAAEPELFLEFKSHFTLMGEKSFDQVKKFWFNKLRRLYHLKEKPKPAKETIVKEKIASQAEPLSSPTIDQKPVDPPVSKPVSPDADEVEKAVIKPKFTPRNIPAKPKGTVIGDLPLEEVKKEDASKPAASYKPRFNPKNIKPKDTSDTISPISGSNKESGEETAGTATTSNDTSTIDSSSNPETTAKPSFKPRFNMKNIKPKEQSPDTENQEEAREPSGENRIESGLNTSPTPEASNETKPAYKPRFKMKNVQPKEESGISIPGSAPEKGEEINALTTIPEGADVPEEKVESVDFSEGEQLEKTRTKQAYKPRFKMKNVQPKEESGISIPASAEPGGEEDSPQPLQSEAQDQTADVTPKEEEENPQKEEAKPAYKPRFNIKNIKR